MRVTPENASISKGALWTGRILSGLAVAFLLFDAVGKLSMQSTPVEATVKLGYPEYAVRGIGIALLASTLIYATPYTAVLGAILLTGYLGGAVATHVRVGNPLFQVVFPVIMGLLVWGGLYLRDKRLRALIPIRL